MTLDVRQITSKNPPNGNEYSSVCAFNCDNTRLLLLTSNLPATLDHFALYDGDGNFLKDLPIAANQEPRWSRTEPKRLYYIEGNALMELIQGEVVDAQAWGTLHTFTEYVSISGKGESDASVSLGSPSFVFAGIRLDGGTDIFTYSLKDGKGQVYPQAESFDGLKITPSNHIILSRADGLRVVDTATRLTDKNGHAVPSKYKGRDIILFCTSAEGAQNAVDMIDVASGWRTTLKAFDWKYGMHISACDQEWCLVSLFTLDGSLPSQLWRLHFDGSAPELLGNIPGVYRDYTSQPKASLSRDGSRAVFSVDDGTAVNVWMVKLEQTPTPDAVPWRKIDLSAFGDRDYMLVLHPNGTFEEFER